jgi:hypothetical protein
MFVGYSNGMNTIMIPEKAPEISAGYPGPRRQYPAWQAAWDILRAAPAEYVDGRELAERSVEVAGGQIEPVTMTGILTRAANAGLLERDHRPVKSGRGMRTRTFYRIKAV